MTPPPFNLLLVCREAGRPALVRRALQEPPAPVPVTVTALPPDSLDGEGASAAARTAAAADLVLVSHVLVAETAEAVAHLLETAVRPDASILVLNSLPGLMRHSRLRGTEVLGGAPRLPAPVRDLLNAGDMTPHLRELMEGLPQLLAELPAGPTPLRTWLEAQLYWREPTPRNLRSLVLMLAARCGPGPEPPPGAVRPPEVPPQAGLYHPATGITGDAGSLPSPESPTGCVGLLLQRGPVLAGDTRATDAFVELLEARGLRVLPVFAGSFDYREAVHRHLVPAAPDALVSLSGFPLVGGHNRLQAQAARELLRELDVPYLTLPALMTQDVESWRRSSLGLAPIETAMQLAVHELEGGIEPLVVQGPERGGGGRMLLEDRARRSADRLVRWIRLRRKPAAEKRLALIVFAFPPGKGSVGTAAYLDVFASAWRILARLKEEGWQVDLPGSPRELLERVVTGADKQAPLDAAEMAVAGRLSAGDYERLVPEWRRARRLWGDPPGALDTDGRDLLIHGVRLGNVFLGVQPTFGFEGDPMRLLFDPAASPHHGFLAFYRWIEEVFEADAVLHLGTHGALEFMPGKQAGLSGACWPDVLSGTLPDLYLYAVNNPSEGTIAKRRGLAVTVGHLTPPLEQAGLHRRLAELEELVAGYREEADPGGRLQQVDLLVERAGELDLLRDVPVPAPGDLEEADRFAAGLAGVLKETAATRIPVGLHVAGRRPESAECVELLAAMAEPDRSEPGTASLMDLLLEERGRDPESTRDAACARDPEALDLVEEVRGVLRQAAGALADGDRREAGRVLLQAAPGLQGSEKLEAGLERLATWARRLADGDELAPLVAALNGRHVPAGPGGDPVRDPDVLPVGRNLHALDPAAIPGAGVLRRARRTVDLLLARRRRELGHWPRRIGLVLWGLDNIKTRGEAIAQAFLLLGVRPARNDLGRVARLEVIPLEELGRPRIDVTVQASGIFRDLFGHHLRLLDEAVRLVAGLDEPHASNFVRAGVQALAEEAGLDRDAAATRVFSNAPGAYGTHLDHMIALSSWEREEDLAGMFLRRKGFAYGGDDEGRAAGPVLEALAAGIDTTFQNLDSHEVALTDVDHYFEYLGGLSALVHARSGRRPGMLVGDATGPAPAVRPLDETLRLESRTRLLNPRWQEGMLRHGFEGAEEIRKRLDYTFGWSATADAVSAHVYREAHRAFLEDDAMRERLRAANPHAFAAMVERLGEAAGRGFWTPGPDEQRTLEALREACEDAAEGIPRDAAPSHEG